MNHGNLQRLTTLFLAGLPIHALAGCERLIDPPTTTGKKAVVSSTASGLTPEDKAWAGRLQATQDPAQRSKEAKTMLQTAKAPSMQLLAIQSLAHDKSGVQEIAVALRTSSDPMVRLNAAGALVRIDSEEARAALAASYQTLTDDQDRARVLQAQAAFGDQNDLAFIDDVIAKSSGELKTLAQKARMQAEAR